MRVLFDQGTPVPLRPFLTRHSVRTIAEQQWSTLGNGELLDAAEAAGFQVYSAKTLSNQKQAGISLPDNYHLQLPAARVGSPAHRLCSDRLVRHRLRHTGGT